MHCERAGKKWSDANDVPSGHVASLPASRRLVVRRIENGEQSSEVDLSAWASVLEEDSAWNCDRNCERVMIGRRVDEVFEGRSGRMKSHPTLISADLQSLRLSYVEIKPFH
jgi:hypothetical protein